MRQLAEAEARKAEAEAEARNARSLAEAEEAEALAQISLESIKLKAEEKLMALSQRGSSAMVSTKTSKFKLKVRSRFGWDRSASNIKIVGLYCSCIFVKSIYFFACCLICLISE